MNLRAMTGKAINVDLHHEIINYADQLFDEKEYARLLKLIKNLADYESKKYIGFLGSNRIEELLNKVGARLFPSAQYKHKDRKKRRVLHVGTEFYNVGGHSRVAIDWINYDSESSSELLLLNQNEVFSLAVGALVHYIKEENDIERARAFRSFLKENYFDVIVIHQHMDDVVPAIALWDLKEKSNTLVLYYNHANFRFSLGHKIGHKRVNFCSGDAIVSQELRYPIKDEVLHFVLGESLPERMPDAQRIALKKEIGFENNTIFFTIGSAYKYSPFREMNFMKEWNTFLKREPSCALVVVGCSYDDFKVFCPNEELANNLLLLGTLDDPTQYYQIADYIVDIYPLQTGLGMIYGLFYGLPPILPYQENVMVIGKHIDSLYPDEVIDFLSYDSSEAYFEFLEQELKDQKYKTWARDIVKEHVIAKMLAPAWKEEIKNIYNINTSQLNLVENINQDVLNESKASKNWYDFTASSSRSFELLSLALRYNIPFKLKYIIYYIMLVLYFRRIKGTGIKVLFNYLIGNYK